MPEQAEPPTADWFDDLFRSHHADMVRLARFLTSNQSAAEDVVQDAFTRLYGRTRPDQPPGYLRTTVVNLCTNWHRTNRRAALRLVRHGVESTVLSPMARDLDATLMRLPYRERAVIVLRYWAGMSEAEIADALGCRPGTVKSRHSRALATIRKELS